MMAELYGKSDGCAGGKAGSMHLVGMDKYILGASAVVGTTIPISLGYALALQRESLNRVIALFFGDGATEEGVFNESLNFAAIHKLPALFIMENNSLAIHSRIEKRQATDRLCDRVNTYGIPTHRIEGNDVFEIYKNSKTAIESLRQGKGPVFLECMTYRWREHVGPEEDYDQNYRTRKELENWQKKDQMTRLAEMIELKKKDKIDNQIEDEIREAVLFAEDSNFPTIEELEKHVFA